MHTCAAVEWSALCVAPQREWKNNIHCTSSKLNKHQIKLKKKKIIKRRKKQISCCSELEGMGRWLQGGTLGEGATELFLIFMMATGPCAFVKTHKMAH